MMAAGHKAIPASAMRGGPGRALIIGAVAAFLRSRFPPMVADPGAGAGVGAAVTAALAQPHEPAAEAADAGATESDVDDVDGGVGGGGADEWEPSAVSGEGAWDGADTHGAPPVVVVPEDGAAADCAPDPVPALARQCVQSALVGAPLLVTGAEEVLVEVLCLARPPVALVPSLALRLVSAVRRYEAPAPGDAAGDGPAATSAAAAAAVVTASPAAAAASEAPPLAPTAACPVWRRGTALEHWVTRLPCGAAVLRRARAFSLHCFKGPAAYGAEAVASFGLSPWAPRYLRAVAPPVPCGSGALR
jgi:hypothetical protein